MKDYAKAIYKLELTTENYIFDISFPDEFMEKEVAKTPYQHIHAKHEVVLVCGKNGEGPGFFQVNPPRCKHAICVEEGAQPQYLTSVLFSIKKHRTADHKQPCAQSSLLDAYFTLQDSVIVPDTFGGKNYFFDVRKEMLEQKKGYLEIAQAKMMMMLLELARNLPTQQCEEQPRVADFDELKMDLIDEFFIQNCASMDCKREDLAELLCISERQLSRILAVNYSMSFRGRLLQTRMELAESLRKSEHLTAEQLAERVGYSSASAFRAAYKHYFGYPFLLEGKSQD